MASLQAHGLVIFEGLVCLHVGSFTRALRKTKTLTLYKLRAKQYKKLY